MKKLIVDLTPPLLLRFGQKMWRRMRGFEFYTFEGNYSSIADVPCGKNNWDDNEFAEMLAASELGSLQSAGTPKKGIDDNGYLILPLIVSQLRDERFSVLDFGGGTGVGLVSILDHVPNIDLSKLYYTIVETPAMRRAISDKLPNTLKAKYGTSSFAKVVDEIPNSLTNLTIVNAAGSLQYIDMYQRTLGRLAALSPRYFIVSNTPMTEIPTYACQQLNMRNKVAQWVFNRNDFFSEMRKLNYEVIFVVNHDVPFTHKNAPAPSGFMSMVFCRV